MMDSDRPSRLSARGFAALFVVLLALSAIPFCLTPILPLLDYPNHLARMHLLPRIASPVLRQFYATDWAPIPDLAMDGIVPFLALLMPLAWAGKVFVFACLAMLAAGVAAIHRVLFGGWSLWPCLAFLLLYTRLLLWGFVAYLFGCGLALIGLAVWIALRDRSWILRLLIGVGFALAIYLSHLLAFGLYAVMIAAYEFGRVFRERMRIGAAFRTLAIGGIPFLPALALMAQNSSEGRISYGNPLRKIDLLFSVFDNYSRPFDVTCFVVAVLAVAYVFQRRWVRVAPEVTLPLVALVITYLAMPTQLFTASGVDRRIPMMIFLLLIAGSRWRVASAVIERRFMMAAAAMYALRLAIIALVWHNSDRLYTQLLAGLDKVPVGSCIAPAFNSRGIEVQRVPLTHFPVLAVALRDAFVPTIFHYRMQQPIRLQPEAEKLADLLSPDGLWHAFVDDSESLPPARKAALGKCGYIAFVGTKPFTVKDTKGLAPAFITPRFQLYRAVPPTAPVP